MRTMQAAETHLDAPSLEALRSLVKNDWAAVNRLIFQRLGSDVALVNQVAHHIIHGGGKRLRPLAVLLAARACGYKGTGHVPVAVIIEFIHTATLLHDDVVDESALRRGRKTANSVFGNQASVLVGDFLYSRAFQMMVEVGEMDILDVLANATNTIAEGEVLQLMHCNNPDLAETDYLEVIFRKTAKLFEAGAECAAIIARQDRTARQALVDYGRHLGLAFQLVDDALDYNANGRGTRQEHRRRPGRGQVDAAADLRHGQGQRGGTAHDPRGDRDRRHAEPDLHPPGHPGHRRDCGTRRSAHGKRPGPRYGRWSGCRSTPYREGLITLARFAVNRRF